MTRDVSEITKVLDLLSSCCENIEEAGACSRCPLKMNCLKETDLMTIAYDVSPGTFRKFIGLSDDADNYADERDYEDQMRKGERDERYFDELYGI